MIALILCLAFLAGWFSWRKSIRRFLSKCLPAWCLIEMPAWVGFVPSRVATLLRTTWIVAFMKRHPIAGLIFYPRKWLGDGWDKFVCFFWGNFDSILFCSIVVCVYGWLRRKPRFRKEGTFTFMSAFASGIKAGALIAGFAEFGRKLDPRNVKGANLVAELVELFGRVFNDTPKEGLPVDEDEDDGFLDMARKIIPGVKKLLTKYRSRIAYFVLSVLVGVMLFAFFHHREWFESFAAHEGRGSGKAKRGNTNKKMRRLNKATKGKKKHFVLYDAADRADIMSCTYNGKPIDAPMVGQPFAAGRWVIFRKDEDGNVVQDDFLVESVSCNEPVEKIEQKPTLPVTVVDDVPPFVVPKKPVPKEVQAARVPKKDVKKDIVCFKCGYTGHYANLCQCKELPRTPKKAEALVAGSTKMDFKSHRQNMGQAIASDGSVVAQIVVSWIGILVNAHVYKDCSHFKFGDKVVEKTTIVHRDVGENHDLLACKKFDGCPEGLNKARFAEPELNQKVWFLARDAMISNGIVTYIGDGAEGLELRTTCSTEGGDCGGLYVNTNGRVVGVHFAAGRPKVDNRAIPVTARMLQLVPKN